MNPAVWTWEVPVYFWFGGIAAGSSFVALACDLAGDHRSARIARRVALGALMPSPPLLIMDLGRPERFYNMLRIFKPRSPMSMGAWCLSVFGGLGSRRGRRGPDRPPARGARARRRQRGRRRLPRARTPACCWRRPPCRCGRAAACSSAPIFVSHRRRHRRRRDAAGAGRAPGCPRATAPGTRSAGSRPPRSRSSSGMSTLERAPPGRHRRRARARAARASCSASPSGACAAGWRCGCCAAAARARTAHHVASVLYLAGGLAFRYAWVAAGHNSATDDEAVARMARHEEGRP